MSLINYIHLCFIVGSNEVISKNGVIMTDENSKKSTQNMRFEKEARALKKNLAKRKQQEQALKSEKGKKMLQHSN